MTSPTNKIMKKWSKCTACKIGTWAHRHVIGEGVIPAAIMFVGEGPGVSEDALGIPFVGPSGRLLKAGLADAHILPDMFYLTNLVACRPCDGPSKQNRAPSRTEVANCTDRLRTLTMIVRPQIIVAVGAVPAKYLGECFLGYPVRAIAHPSYVLRNGGIRGPLYKNWLSSLKFISNLID